MKIKTVIMSLLLAACTFICACGSKGGGKSSESSSENSSSESISSESSSESSSSESSSSESSSSESSSVSPETGDIVTEPEENYNEKIEGMLHDVNVDFNNAVSDFVANGQTKYTLVYGNANSNKAAGFISEHIQKATGADIKMDSRSLSVEDVTESTQYIFIGCESLFAELGLEMPTYETLDVAGYQIQTYGKNVFINTYGTLGAYQMGAIAFLRAVLGYDMFSEDCVIYEKDGQKMPFMDIVERPDFDYRQANGVSVSNTEMYGMGYSYTTIVMNTGTSWMHNINDFVSVEEANDMEEKYGYQWRSMDDTKYQMCFTARGNKESYTALVEHIAEKIKNYLLKNPACDTMIIGQNDIVPGSPSVQNCKCTACQASYDYYGTMGGAWLSLCNRASLLVDEWLQSDEGKAAFGTTKTWNLLQLVYHTHVNPPIEKDSNGYLFDENGKGVSLDEMWFDENGDRMTWETAWTDAESGETKENSEKIAAWSSSHKKIDTAPNVHYMYATSQANWVHSYYDEENSSWKNICDGWAGVSSANGDTVGGEFFVWAYTMNSKYALYPYNSFDTSWETTRYFKRVGAKYIYWQSHYENKNNSGFTKLKNYLDSKVEFDVNADYTFYVKKFFKYYFGAAGDMMLKYFEEVQAQCRWIEKVNQVGGNIHNDRYGYKENWPEGLIVSWKNMMDSAYDLLEDEYKASNPDLYEVYTRHVKIEQQFPLIVLCTTYADSYEPEALKALRKKFMTIFYDELGNKVHAESTLMTDITNTWNLD